MSAWRARAACSLWAVFALAWLVPLAGGYFLSDDFGFVGSAAAGSAHGTLLRDSAAAFLTGQTAGATHFYRPLAHASFALCYALFGSDAAAWIAVNLAAHLGCAALVAMLALRLQADRSWRTHAAALAGATVFLCFAPGIEAAAWVAARCDTFATLFALLACLAFLDSRRRWDAPMALSLGAFVAAMLSKESAAIVPPAIFVLCLWRRRDEPLRAVARALAALRDALPWIALGVGYLAMRAVIFGSPFTVYGNSTPGLFFLDPQRWIAIAAAAGPWSSAQVPAHGPRMALLVLLVALAVTSLAVKRLDPDKRAGILAVAALLVLSTAQFIPFIGLAADGTGGRQFHLPGAFLGVLAGLVGASSRARGAALAVVVALAIATISTGSRSRDRWIATESVMRSIAGQIASIHANAKGNEYDLVVIPGTYGPMPFGLQATGGLITSPIQNPPVSNRVLVQVDTDIPGIATGFARGIIANLRRLPLDALDSRGVEGAPEYPSRVFCWVPKQPSLVELPPAPDASPAAWAQATRAAMKAAHCAGSFG